MLYRLQKFAIGVTHLAFLVLLVRTLGGCSRWDLSVGCLVLSALWFGLTVVQVPRLLSCYADRMARLQLLVPLFTGVTLSIVGAVAGLDATAYGIGAGLLLAWGVIYYMFRRTGRNYYKLGFGYMWNDAYINPTCEAIGRGDIVLTDGNMARRTGNTVGHAELAVADPSGKLWVFSSYQGKGALRHSLRALIKIETDLKQHYIVLKPVTPWTDEQNAAAWTYCMNMLARNKVWKQQQTEQRTRRINRLPILAAWKTELLKRFTPHDGYDWMGVYLGTIKKDRWTCMSMILEVLAHINVKMEKYGTGPLGLTGLLNPLLPIRLATRAKSYALLRKSA